MPGVLAGLVGALMAGLATEKEYGERSVIVLEFLT